jgi:hypothetical protein
MKLEAMASPIPRFPPVTTTTRLKMPLPAYERKLVVTAP